MYLPSRRWRSTYASFDQLSEPILRREPFQGSLVVESQAENFQLQAMLACWAKLSQRDEPDVYHPLLCHMIDVAVVAGEMWSSVLSPGKRSEIAKGLGLGENQDSAGVWCAFLAGLHDLGKASPDFQLQVSRVRAEVTKRLRGIGLPVKTGRSPKTSPHGTITAATLHPY